MKHYTIQLHTRAGNLLDYVGIDAENKSDLRKKVAEFNKKNPDKWLALKTAFHLPKKGE